MESKLNFSKREKKQYFFAVDIGNEKIKTIIFEREKGKIAILGGSFQSIEGLGTEKYITIKKAILKSIEELKEKIPKKKEIPVLLGLPADILKATLFFYSFKRTNPKNEIQEREEKEIYQTTLKESQREIAKFFSRFYGILPKDFKFINLEISEIKIDGYEVSHLRGFKGQDLDFKIMAIFSPKHYPEFFKKIFEEIGLKVFKIIHPVQNLKMAFGDNISDGIFLNIRDDLTQIFLIKEGKISFISRLEIGGKNFTKTLSQDLGLSEKMAENLKEKYSQRNLSEEARQKIKKILEDILQEWFSNLKSKLRETKQFPLPYNFYLLGEGSNLPDIKEILEGGEWENLIYIQKPKVNLVSLKDFKNTEDKTNLFNNPQAISSILICYIL
jgi:cell division ATPase FtsA